jgi:hypothetical protein
VTTRTGSGAGGRALTGWARFAAIVLVINGSFNIIKGGTAPPQ